jgi:Tol biopolymer transport system component
MRDLVSGADRELLTGIEKTPGVSVVPSPDGQYLAVIPIGNAGGQTLSVFPLRDGSDSSREVLKMTSPDTMFILGWTPDSQHILFNRSDDIWWISPQGGQPRRLDFGPMKPGSVSVHPDGKRIAFRVSETDREVWVLENLPRVSRSDPQH